MEDGGRFRRVLLGATRLWLPVTIAVIGVVAIVVGHGRTGVAAVGVGFVLIALIVWMINWMFRMSVASNADRDREERARDFFDRTGGWPDE